MDPNIKGSKFDSVEDSGQNLNFNEFFNDFSLENNRLRENIDFFMRTINFDNDEKELKKFSDKIESNREKAISFVKDYFNETRNGANEIIKAIKNGTYEEGISIGFQELIGNDKLTNALFDAKSALIRYFESYSDENEGELMDILDSTEELLIEYIEDYFNKIQDYIDKIDVARNNHKKRMIEWTYSREESLNMYFEEMGGELLAKIELIKRLARMASRDQEGDSSAVSLVREVRKMASKAYRDGLED